MNTAYRLRMFRANLGMADGPLGKLMGEAADELDQLYKAKRGDWSADTDKLEATNDR